MLSRQIKNQRLKHRSTYRDTSTHPKHSQSEPSRTPQTIRVVQSHLVYVIGLKPEICDESILVSKQFFGKFGNVSKVVINKRGSTNRKYYRDISYAAHITYDDEVSASLAVITLFEFKYHDHLMRSCYGYTKYCESFFYTNECQKTDCVYLHEFQTEQEIISDGCDKEVEKENFQKQLKLALKIIYENRRQIIRDYREEKENSEFPDIYESMKSLISYGYMTEEEYEREWEVEDTLKCYTESTETSPIKEYESDEEKGEEIGVENGQGELEAEKLRQRQKEKEKQRQKQKQSESEGVRQKQTLGSKQNSSEQTPSPDQIEQMISRSILRVLRGKNRHIKSKFQFVQEGTKDSEGFKDLFEKEWLYRS